MNFPGIAWKSVSTSIFTPLRARARCIRDTHTHGWNWPCPSPPSQEEIKSIRGRFAIALSSYLYPPPRIWNFITALFLRINRGRKNFSIPRQLRDVGRSLTIPLHQEQPVIPASCFSLLFFVFFFFYPPDIPGPSLADFPFRVATSTRKVSRPVIRFESDSLHRYIARNRVELFAGSTDCFIEAIVVRNDDDR